MVLEKYVNLGKTEIKISHIGLGIMQWRNFSIEQDEASINQEIQGIYHAALEGGINFFDTAESYGNGRSEIHLGKCLKGKSDNLIIATKFMPYPWRLSKGELRSALLRSLKRLGLSHVDLYQMHWPLPFKSIRSWMDAMSDAVSDGLIRAVGVSNYSPSQTSLAYEQLAKHHIPLASNQVRYSLLHRHPEHNGLVDLCAKLGITIIAYSPLEKGILTGRYNPDNLPSDFRSWIYNRSYLIKIKPLMDAIRQIGDDHSGKTSGQVALNWLTCKGAVPIPGARNKKQAQENAGGLEWQLSAEEVERLYRISEEVSR